MNIVKALRWSSIKSSSSLLFRNKYSVTEITNEISFTPRFHEAIQEKLGSKGSKFLRLEINAGEGCEGFTYKFKFDDKIDSEKDYVKSQTLIANDGKESQRVIFAVNGEEIKLLRGATLDFAEEMMRQVFYVKENPNADMECSCKVSFSPKAGVL